MLRILKIVKKILVILILTILSLSLLYGLFVCNPQFLFKYHTEFMNLKLYSDKPIPENATMILQDVQSRLIKSDIYDNKDIYKIFICNDPIKFFLFSTYENKQAGATSFPYISSNSFLRKSKIEDNRLIGARGIEVGGNRTLAYFITHEITHCIVGKKIGTFSFLSLPKWLSEGYSEYIAEASLADVPPFYRSDYIRIKSLIEEKGLKIMEIIKESKNE